MTDLGRVLTNMCKQWKRETKIVTQVFYHDYSQFKNMYLWKTIPSKIINVSEWRNIYFKKQKPKQLKKKTRLLSQYSNSLQVEQLCFNAQHDQDFCFLHSVHTGCGANKELISTFIIILSVILICRYMAQTIILWCCLYSSCNYVWMQT